MYPFLIIIIYSYCEGLSCCRAVASILKSFSEVRERDKVYDTTHATVCKKDVPSNSLQWDVCCAVRVCFHPDQEYDEMNLTYVMEA
mgnify:CR=1 FL=1